MDGHMDESSTTVHLPTLRLLWRASDNPAAPVVLTLCDEIERLRRELDSAQRGERHYQRDAKHQRDELYRRQVAVTKALNAVSDAMHGRAPE